MEPPVLPTWFKYRQGMAEPSGEQVMKLTAPNLPEAFIAVRAEPNGRWAAVLRRSADGPEVAASSPDFGSAAEAWGAAFELYRNYIVVGPEEQG